MRYLTVLFILLISHINAQNTQEFFRAMPSPSEIANAPAWARLMYSENPQVNDVVDAYYDYFDKNPFKKTIHTQNFKHWIRRVEPLLNNKALIEPPTPEEEAIQFERLKSLKTNNKSMDVWTSIGPFETYKNGTTQAISTHANVYSIDQSTNNDQLLICGTESSGVYKTTDKGLTWDLISKDEVFCNGITGVAIHPNNDNIFYVGGNSRLYRSTDGGVSWTENYNLGGAVYEIKFDPDDVNRIFLAASNGLYVSTNGGGSWSRPYTTAVWDIDFHPTDHDTVYMLKSNPGAVKTEFFRSINSGTTWSLVTSGWYNPQVPAEASENGGKIGVSPDEPDRVYATLIGASKANDNGWIGIYRSNDSGSNWYLPSGQIGGPYQPINTMPWNAAAYGSGYHQGFYNFDFEVSPNDADLMWFGTIRLNESSDGGASYVSIGAANSTRLNDVHADIQSIHVDGNDVWVASDGGINYSNDNLNSHTSRKYGIIGADFWGFGAGWNDDVLVGGKYHNGNTVYFDNYGVGESHNVGGVEESTGYVNSLNNKNAYFNQYWSGYTVSKIISDTLGGAAINTNPIYLIPNEAYTTSYSSGFYHHPNFADHMIAGKDSIIWQSKDGGTNWSVLHDFGNGRVLEMEYCKMNPSIIYAVFQPNGGYWDWCEVHRTTDGGQTWTKLTNIPSNNRWRLEITVNPENGDEVYVGTIDGANGQKIYKSTNGGASWTNMTTSIFDGDKVRDLAYHGGSGGLLYALTQNSFFYFDPAVPGWVQYDSGLPVIQNVLKLHLFYRDKKIRMSSKGRGFWEAPMPQTFSPIAQIMTATDSLTCGKDTIQFDSHSIVDQINTSWTWSISPAPQHISDVNARNPKVVFGANGSYDITLDVVDNGGLSSSHTFADMVHLDNQCSVDTIPGLALQTVGSGDWVQLPNFGVTTNSFTVTAWVKPEGIQDDYAGIVMNDGDQTAGLNFREGNNTLGYHWPGGAWWWDSNLVVPEGQWSYVALVAEPSGITIYLNGVGVKHTTTINTAELTTMKIGSYKGWGSRNYRGEIDEVSLWNRALSEDEIRLLRHLTRDGQISDPDFLAYYQFNRNNSTVLDKVNLFHGTATGNSGFGSCFIPVGSGESTSQVVNTAGTYTFGTTGVEMVFPGTGTFPNDAVYATRLNTLPLPDIGNGENLGSYWVINNYGDIDFSDPFDLKLDDPNSSPSAAATGSPSSIDLIQRNDNSETIPWNELCSANSIAGEQYIFLGSDGCNNSVMGQYFMKFCIPSAIITQDYLNGEVISIQTSDFIEAYNTIFSGADVQYSSQNDILLGPDFEVKLGALFEALMQGCID